MKAFRKLALPYRLGLLFVLGWLTACNALPTTVEQTWEPPLTPTTPIDDAQSNQATREAVLTRIPEIVPTLSPVQPTLAFEERIDRCINSGRGVRYIIMGEGVFGVLLTWRNDSGGINSGEYRVPFCWQFDAFEFGETLFISAVIIPNEGESGRVECLIYNGTELVAQAEATGFEGEATCSGQIDPPIAPFFQ